MLYIKDKHTILTCDLSIKNDKYIYICTDYTLYIQQMPLYEPLQHNTVEYIHGHYFTMMPKGK